MTDAEKAAAKAEKANASDFNLLVSLIMREKGVSKAKASVQAFAEGRDGLDLRLGQMRLPL